LKILHLIYTEAVSGAENYVKHLIPGLKQFNINCDLIVVSPRRTAPAFTEYCNQLNALGIPTTLIIANRVSIIATAIKINAYLRKHKIKIVHSHLLNSDLIAAVLKTLFYPKLYLISSKHGYQEKVLQQYEPGMKMKLNDLYYYITKFTLRKINSNLCVSNAIAELFINLGFTKEKYPYIHHGITINEFNKEACKAQCRRANPQIIIVGRIELFKGHHFLLDAMPEVIKNFPTIKLLVIGEGSEKNNCINKVAQLGLQNHVDFLGFQSNPYSFISHSDVIILPSLFEPFGLVYIEAFALQTPVIAFNTAAGNEIMEDGKTAILVKKCDSNALAQKIIYLLNNKEMRDKLASQARQKYETHFTSEVMIKNTADWYVKLPV